MYKKLKSLKELQKNRFNIFTCVVLDPMKDDASTLGLIAFLYDKVTVRFDSEIETMNDLPFYILEADSGISKCKEIMDKAKMLNCILIVSAGINDDCKMKYNLVYKVNNDGSFMLEASTLKVPLRHMYNSLDGRVVIYGNIFEEIQDWQSLGYGVDRRELRDIIVTAYFNEHLVNKWVECSVYREDVGGLKENIIYWQIRQST